MSTTETIIEGGAGVAVLAGAAGMPQLDPSTFPNQIFWLVVALVAVYFVLAKLALPRIAGTLANRKGTITTDLAAADELKLKARAAEKAYTEALATARSEAAKIIVATKAEIQADLNAAIATADAEIAAKSAESVKRIDDIRDGAVEAVAAVAKDTAGALIIALGGKADAMAIEAAVSERLKG